MLVILDFVECAGKEGCRLCETTASRGANRNHAIEVEGCGDIASYVGNCLFPLAFAHLFPVDEEFEFGWPTCSPSGRIKMETANVDKIR